MNINIINNSDANNKTKIRHLPHSFTSNPSLSEFNNKYNKRRPLETNPQDLSFKGLFYKEVCKEGSSIARKFDAEGLVTEAEKHLGSSARTLFENLKNNKSGAAKKLITIDDGNSITFHKKTVLKLILDGIAYPFTTLPLDILNAVVNNLKKITPLKKLADRIYNSPTLKSTRQRSKLESKVNALRGLLESVEKHKNNPNISSELFQSSIKMFDPKTGNYDTKHERSLCRIVSGAVPAFFLANDAYNLSMMYSGNKDEAQKEQKARFKQEVVRVGANAYLTLITLGAIQKYINNSKLGIMLNTGLTVLFTESMARLASGKSLTRLTPEQAKEINAKNNPNINFQADNKTQNSKKDETKKEIKDSNKEPLLSVNTLLKASALVIATGFGVRGLRKIQTFDKAYKAVTAPFKNLYKTLAFESDFKLEKDKFDKIVALLDNEDFKPIAEKYRAIGKQITEGNYVHLGQKDKKIKPFVDFVVAPFKFIFGVVKFPYEITNKVVQLLIKDKNITKEALSVDKKDIKALATSIDKLTKASEKYNPEDFKSFVDDNILKAFNVDNVSNLPNSQLANLAKTSATAATIWFLMTDNYNMAMLKSNGEDVEGAEEKFKGRFVQEGSRLFYQTLLIDLFNSTFRTQYHNSLWGMSWITASNTLISEILNRKSIGMPVLPHSKQELAEIEKQKSNATGFVKSYYNFMARLTGKKTLAEQQAQKKK